MILWAGCASSGRDYAAYVNSYPDLLSAYNNGPGQQGQSKTSWGAWHYQVAGQSEGRTVPGTATQFLYDGNRLVAEYNASGALLRRYGHGAGVDEPLIWYEGSGLGTRNYLHTDELGSGGRGAGADKGDRPPPDPTCVAAATAAGAVAGGVAGRFVAGALSPRVFAIGLYSGAAMGASIGSLGGPVGILAGGVIGAAVGGTAAFVVSGGMQWASQMVGGALGGLAGGIVGRQVCPGSSGPPMV